MKRAVLYARVSSKEQEREGYSIPAQKKLLRNYARTNRIEVVEEFVDVETAKAAGRENFGQMVEFLKSSQDARVILVEKTDRLYRNFKDYVLLEDFDLEIHLVKENEVISKNSHSHAKFIHGIKLLMAKNYIDNLSEETKKGLREKAEQGEWPQKAPYGYTNDKSTHLVEPNPAIAPLIVRAFKLYASGEYSLLRLKNELFVNGLKSRTGKPLSKSQMELVLTNPFYYGEFIWNGQRYQGIHQPLITRDLYDQAQTALRRHGKPKGRRRTFAFTGLLKCGRCGCQITAEFKKGKYTYYRCTGGRGKCDQPYIREELLDEKLAELLSAIRINQKAVDSIVKALKSSYVDELEYRGSELRRLKLQDDHLQTRLDKAYEDRLDGIIGEAYWLDVCSRWRASQDAVKGQIDRFESANRNYVDQGVQILELAQEAYSLYMQRDVSERRELLNCVLSNCVIDDLTLYPTYKKPFDLIAEGLKTQLKLR